MTLDQRPPWDDGVRVIRALILACVIGAAMWAGIVLAVLRWMRRGL